MPGAAGGSSQQLSAGWMDAWTQSGEHNLWASVLPAGTPLETVLYKSPIGIGLGGFA